MDRCSSTSLTCRPSPATVRSNAGGCAPHLPRDGVEAPSISGPLLRAGGGFATPGFVATRPGAATANRSRDFRSREKRSILCGRRGMCTVSVHADPRSGTRPGGAPLFGGAGQRPAATLLLWGSRRVVPLPVPAMPERPPADHSRWRPGRGHRPFGLVVDAASIPFRSAVGSPRPAAGSAVAGGCYAPMFAMSIPVRGTRRDWTVRAYADLGGQPCTFTCRT